MNPSSQHILMSVSKSLLGLLIGVLIDQNLFKPNQQATDILPEVERTAYQGVSIQQLLDMRAGVVFEEDYLATQGKIIEYRKATNWNPVAKNEPESDLRSFYNLSLIHN